MPHYFFDTSAVAKHYHAEAGTPRVEALLATPDGTFTVSRLSVVELHSALAKKVRTGPLTRTEFERVTRRFRSDVTAKRWRVVRLLVAHYQAAERLIRRVGLTQGLRTLDALQLAVAVSLNEPGRAVGFVSADQNLCAIAAAEGLSVNNPEVP